MLSVVGPDTETRNNLAVPDSCTQGTHWRPLPSLPHCYEATAGSQTESYVCLSLKTQCRKSSFTWTAMLLILKDPFSPIHDVTPHTHGTVCKHSKRHFSFTKLLWLALNVPLDQGSPRILLQLAKVNWVPF